MLILLNFFMSYNIIDWVGICYYLLFDIILSYFPDKKSKDKIKISEKHVQIQIRQCFIYRH